jgi:hypothetical protein
MSADARIMSPVVALQSDLEPVDGGISVVVPVYQSEKTLLVAHSVGRLPA